MQGEQGFTFVELLLTLILTSVLFAGTTVIMSQGLNSYVFLSDRAVDLQTLRIGTERMVRELGGVAQSGIKNISSSQISFVDSLGNNTDFHWDAATQTLFRGSDKLLMHVTSVTFTGYKDDGTVTSAGPQVRRIRMALQCLPLGQASAIVWQTDVYLRNYLYDTYL